MYQGYDGQWYDDQGNPTQGPDSGGSPVSPPNTQGPASASTAAAGPVWGGAPYVEPKPNGIPDPNNPGYDTNGFVLGAQATGTGAFGTTWGQPSTTGNSGPAVGPYDWQGLSTQTFGQMPSVGDATPPPFQYDPFSAPAPFSYDAFSAPTASSVMASDPGYQFRLDQGTGAMQNSAAARGVLNTGGTLQDLVNYGQNAASQEYQGGYNRALGTYQTNRNNAFGNYDENYRNSLNAYVTNFSNALTGYNTRYNVNYLTPYNQLMQQYQQGVGNQSQLFNQQFQTATA